MWIEKYQRKRQLNNVILSSRNIHMYIMCWIDMIYLHIIGQWNDLNTK